MSICFQRSTTILDTEGDSPGNADVLEIMQVEPSVYFKHHNELDRQVDNSLEVSCKKSACAKQVYM